MYIHGRRPGQPRVRGAQFEKSAFTEIQKMDHVLAWLEPKLASGVAVIIEGFAFWMKGRAVYELAGLQYLIRHLLFKKAIPFKLVTPNQAKKFLTGKHDCDKNLILKEVLKRYQLDLDDDNVADAVNMNKIGQAMLGLIELDNQAQRDVIAELKSAPASKKRTKKAAQSTAAAVG